MIEKHFVDSVGDVVDIRLQAITGIDPARNDDDSALRWRCSMRCDARLVANRAAKPAGVAICPLQKDRPAGRCDELQIHTWTEGEILSLRQGIALGIKFERFIGWRLRWDLCAHDICRARNCAERLPVLVSQLMKVVGLHMTIGRDGAGSSAGVVRLISITNARRRHRWRWRRWCWRRRR